MSKKDTEKSNRVSEPIGAVAVDEDDFMAAMRKEHPWL
jgi:hypothetical protein